LNSRHYLLHVIGLSAVPRLVTFGLTLLSLPLMIRALGASQYGIIVYVQSIATLLELLASFSVSTAAGKAIAMCRSTGAGRLSAEVRRWGRLQLLVAAISVVPVFVVALLVVRGGGASAITSAIIVTVTSTVYASIAVTFVRSMLQSLLAFKLLAALDTIDSVVRAASWLVVARWFPTALGLATAGLLHISVVAITGAVLLATVLRSQRIRGASGQLAGDGRSPSVREMLADSFSFLALLSATRLYQSLPNILVGRLLGFEMSGIVGAFGRVIEIFSLPSTVIGNALMVRAQEIKLRGTAVVTRYWHLLGRFVIVALVASCGFWFAAGEAAHILLPKTPEAARIFALMTPLVFLRAVSDLFAPASDYVGGLRSRAVFLFLCAALQLPAIWLGARGGGGVGAVVAMVLSYLVMVSGYVAIAKRVFFGRARYSPPKDVVIAALTVAASAGVALLLRSRPTVAIVVYVAAACLGFLSIPALRRQYATGRFLSFDLV